MIEGKLNKEKGIFTYDGIQYDLSPYIYTEKVNQLDEIRRLITLAGEDKPVLCTNYYTWKGIEDHEDPADQLKPGIGNDTMLCIIQWNNSANPGIPAEWSEWTFWEYADPGICRYNGDIGKLESTFRKIGGSNSPNSSDGTVVHIDCPHCGKRIF